MNYVKKVFIENYKQYHIYKIIDAHGNKFFNAEPISCLQDNYINTNITFVANSTNEIYKQINTKIKKIQSYRKAKVF